MKHQNEKPDDRIMKFFTPELYTAFNSEDDAIADRANDSWEQAVQNYHKRMITLREKLPPTFNRLSKLCLHDATLQLFDDLNDRALAMLIVMDKEKQTIIRYSLWGPIRKSPPIQERPFSNDHVQWLYDEIDVDDSTGGFVHRVLFSDGVAVEIPAKSVILNEIPRTKEVSVTQSRMSA